MVYFIFITVVTLTLEVQTPEETDKLIASHTEKIVVVDLWTLW